MKQFRMDEKSEVLVYHQEKDEEKATGKQNKEAKALQKRYSLVMINGSEDETENNEEREKENGFDPGEKKQQGKN